MAKPGRLPLLDILAFSSNVRDFVAGMDAGAFEADLKTHYAVLYALLCISEASRDLDADLKARHPHIRWRDLAGLGSVLRHDYENVQPRRIWSYINEHLGELQRVVVIEINRVPD